MPTEAYKKIRKTKSTLQKTFEEFLLMAKGELIIDPTKIIPTDMMIPSFIIEIIGAKSNLVSFTRLSLKHLAKKGQEGQRLLDLAPHILGNPDEVRQGSPDIRFLISKSFIDLKYGRPNVINIEVTKASGNIVVTAFQAFPKYLKNFELLWRTASPPSQQPP